MYRYSRMKSLIGLLTVVAVVALVCGPTNVQAQDVAVGQATATVLAVLAVTSTANLIFGNVLQGVPTAADKTAIGEAGVFSVAGAGGSEISMFIELPEFLFNSTGGSEDRLVVAFSTTGADIDTTAAGTPAAHGLGAVVDQDPYNLPDTELGGADNVLQIFLGGMVYPAVDQRAGSYTADIVLTVAYTGT